MLMVTTAGLLPCTSLCIVLLCCLVLCTSFAIVPATAAPFRIRPKVNLPAEHSFVMVISHNALYDATVTVMRFYRLNLMEFAED
jgi:hypothetical protein